MASNAIGIASAFVGVKSWYVRICSRWVMDGFWLSCCCALVLYIS